MNHLITKNQRAHAFELKFRTLFNRILTFLFLCYNVLQVPSLLAASGGMDYSFVITWFLPANLPTKLQILGYHNGMAFDPEQGHDKKQTYFPQLSQRRG